MRDAFGEVRGPPAVLTPVELVELDARRRGDRGFGPMVRMLRQDEGIRLGQLAQAVGEPVSWISDVERGMVRADIETVRRIALAIGASFVAIFDIWDREGEASADRTTVAEATAMVKRSLSKGVDCPCCGRLARELRTSLSPFMVSFVSWLASSYRGEPLDVRPWAEENKMKGGRNYAKVVHWGFAEHGHGRDPLWTPTNKGLKFARGEIKVRKVVVLWRNEVVRFDGKLVDISGAGGSVVRPTREGNQALPGMGGHHE